jgi:hypothetical protein
MLSMQPPNATITVPAQALYHMVAGCSACLAGSVQKSSGEASAAAANLSYCCHTGSSYAALHCNRSQQPLECCNSVTSNETKSIPLMAGGLVEDRARQHEPDSSTRPPANRCCCSPLDTIQYRDALSMLPRPHVYISPTVLKHNAHTFSAEVWVDCMMACTS